MPKDIYTNFKIYRLETAENALDKVLWLLKYQHDYTEKSYCTFHCYDGKNKDFVWFTGKLTAQEIIEFFLGSWNEYLAVKLKKDCFLGTAGDVVGFTI